jgi:general secretion pathway protein E
MQMLEGLDDNTDLAHLAEDIPESSDLLESDDEAPIIRLINALLTQAVKENASDIHIEPFENRLVIRFRVDGVLREVLQTKRAVAPLVVSRIKVMSKLDIAERRLPQDGRISRCASPGAPSTCASPRCPRGTASASCCACSTSRPGASS